MRWRRDALPLPTDQQGHRTPHGALTRWLKQGLARGECPLCRVAHRAEKEFLWYFFDEYSTQDAALDALRASHGFCGRHAAGLRRIEVDNLKSTLGISATYEDTLSGFVAELDALGGGAPLREAACPACATRDEAVQKNVGCLLSLLADDKSIRERFAASPGLCVPHFAAALAAAEQEPVRTLLVSVERRAAADLREQLGEHIRKQGAEARHEVPGPEADAWQRAIWLTAGWPDTELGPD